MDKNLQVLLVIVFGKLKEEVVIDNVKDVDIKYYRDSEQVHYVPMRDLKDVIGK